MGMNWCRFDGGPGTTRTIRRSSGSPIFPAGPLGGSSVAISTWSERQIRLRQQKIERNQGDCHARLASNWPAVRRQAGM
jgi:hypothetical protein